MLSNMMNTLGKMMTNSQEEAVGVDTHDEGIKNSNENNELERNKPTNPALRNTMVSEIAAMIINGRRNATDDWIEHVYSFSKKLDVELFREATTEHEYSDKATLQDRVRKHGIALIKLDPSDQHLHKYKELFLFAEDEPVASVEEDQISPRAHPLATSSSLTFQWPTMRSNSGGSGTAIESTAAKARNKALPEIPDVEFSENSVERNAVHKEIVRILRTKRPNSTENWYKSCPNLAPRLEAMLYKHARSLEEYSDLSTVTERVLQFVSLGGFKKPFQVKVVKKVESPSTIIVPKVVPRLDAVFSGTVEPSEEPSFASKKASAGGGSGAASGGTPSRGRPRKHPVESEVNPMKEDETTQRKPSSTQPAPVKKPAPAPKDLLKLQQQRLLLLQHAAKCQRGEGECTVTPHCAPMRKLWSHVKNCSLIKCPVAHCVSSRYVLGHWLSCTDPACRMCQPAREGTDMHLARMTEEDAKAAREAAAAAAAVEEGRSSSTAGADNVTNQDQEPDVKKRKAETQTAVSAKENVINFGDLSGPAAKKRLGAPGGGDASSVHSGTSHHSHHSHLSHHSQHSHRSHHSASSTANRSQSGQSGQGGGGSSNTAQWIQRLFLPVVDELLRVPGAALYFGQPVDPVALGLGNYFDVVKHPMDLGTVRQTLEMRLYRNVQDLVDDVMQTFENARTYNRAGTEVHNLAKKLRTMFSERSRKPRFELSAKLLELQNTATAARHASSSSSHHTHTHSQGPSVHIYRDAGGDVIGGGESSDAAGSSSSGAMRGAPLTDNVP